MTTSLHAGISRWLLMGLTLLILLSACQDHPLFSDADAETGGQVGNAVLFKAIIDDEDAGGTRGIPVSGKVYPDGGSFGVSGYVLPKDVWEPTLTPDFMYNRKVTRTGTQYTYEGTEYWPSSRIRFFAYHPYADASNGVSPSPVDYAGDPFLRFTVKNEVTKQIDLLLSAPASAVAPPSVSFPFTHALTRVGFSVKKTSVPGEVKIVSIVLKNIIGAGQVSLVPRTDGRFTWQPSRLFEDIKEYTLATPLPDGTDRGLISSEEQHITDAGYMSVCSANGTLFLIPQQITVGRSLLIVRYTLDGAERSQEVLLPATSPGSANEWLSGKFVRYQLMLNIAGGTEEISISVDEADANCILLSPVPQTNPTASFVEYSIPVSRANFFYNNPAFTTWNEGVQGISTSDHWGVNVIWMDKANLLSITKPQGSGADDADSGRFKVRIPAGNEGNALVGIYKDINGNGKKDSDEQWLWSWHLWVTDYNPNRYQTGNRPTLQSAEGEWDVLNGKVHRYRDAVSIPDTTNNNGNYGALDCWQPASGLYAGKVMMDRNVGSVSDEFPPLENNIPFPVATVQQRKSPLHVLYYEYGRKDPFLSDAYRYQEDGTALNTIDFYDKQVSLLFSVQNPEKYIHGRQSWATNNPLGCYWYDPRNVATPQRSAATGKKSVFDPCPVGWRLPVNGTWNDFDQSTFLWSTPLLGRVYTPAGSNLRAYYPAEGFRVASTGEVKQTGFHGIYWACSPIPSNSRDYCFRFAAPIDNVLEGTVLRGVVYPSAAVYQTDSFAVRCVQE